MTAATVKPEKLEGATLGDLRKRKAELTKRIEKGDAQQTLDRQRSEGLKAERRTLVLAAQLQKDAGAQSRINAIDEDLPRLDRSLSDQETAAAHLAQQLATVVQEIERGEWEEGRAALRELLEERLKGKVCADLERKVAALAAALRAANEEDQRIAIALISFEPRLRGARDSLQMLKRHREQILGFSLWGLLAIDTHGMTEAKMRAMSAVTSEQQAYESALECLDRLELVF